MSARRIGTRRAAQIQTETLPVDRIAKEVARAVKEPAIAERLAGNGFDAVGSTPEEFAATIGADAALWAEAVKIAGLQEK
jgi:tripartite-type tricarboxylate transporter receptor subunit TctC